MRVTLAWGKMVALYWVKCLVNKKHLYYVISIIVILKFLKYSYPFVLRAKDVNIVAEPKEHQVGRKRQNNTKTGNDWDYYYDR